MLSRTKVPFGRRVRTSNQILGEVRRFLNAERDLWVFPVFATLAFALFLLPIMLWGGSGASGSNPFFDVRFLLVIAIVGIPLTFAMSLLNTAFAFTAWGRMEGHHTTKRQGWARALRSSGVLFRFNLIAAIIGFGISIIGQLLDKLRIIPGVGSIANLVGAYGWALASYFVIPVIAVERERHAFGAIRRSVSIVREQLGTSVTGFVTIQLVLLLVLMPVMLLVLFGSIFFLLPALLANGADLEAVVFPVLVIAFIAPLLIVFVLSQALNTTYQTALYRFAVTGRITHPFSVDTLHTAWEPYRKR